MGKGIMISVLYGEKGKGKTKLLVEQANKMVESCPGHVVFLDDSNDLMHKLDRNIRFINVLEFPIAGESSFIGFICGIVSQNYDIKCIFIDGLTYIVKSHVGQLEDFFGRLKEVSEKFEVDFVISISGSESDKPDFLKEFTA
jgi:thymidine kinase